MSVAWMTLPHEPQVNDEPSPGIAFAEPHCGDTRKVQQETAKAAIKAKKAAIAVTRAQLRTRKGESTRVVKRTYRGEREKWLDFGLPVKIAKAKKKKKSKK